MVVEVLSPTTRDFDTIGKLEEYKLIDSLARIVVVEPNAPEVIVWVRGTDRSWRKATRQGLDQEIDMPEGERAKKRVGRNGGRSFPQARIPARMIRIRHIMEYFLCSRTDTFGFRRDLPPNCLLHGYLITYYERRGGFCGNELILKFPTKSMLAPDFVPAISIRWESAPILSGWPGQARAAQPNDPFVHVPSNSSRIPSYPGSTFGGSLARSLA